MVEPISSTHPRISEWIPEVITSTDPNAMQRYQKETCVNGDVSYKLRQLLSAMTNDYPHDQAVYKATHVINQCLFIREALQIDSILADEYFPAALVPMLEQFSCLSVVGDDNKGNTVIYFNLTKFNAVEYSKCWAIGARPVPTAISEGIYPEFKDPCVVNYCSLWYVRMMEWIHRHRFSSFKGGKSVEPRVVMILNVGGSAIGSSTWSSELRSFLRGIKTLGNILYPEIADYIFAANVPWIADKFWPLIRRVLHPATASKVDLYDTNRTKKFIKEIIHSDQLPKCFGGSYSPEYRFKIFGPTICGVSSSSDTPQSSGECCEDPNNLPFSSSAAYSTAESPVNEES
jgi:hypothetical protein